MGKFYLDWEFTNGNYYLAEKLEIALVAGESGNAFHRNVKIHYSVPQRVQQLTAITNSTIKTLGTPFREEMDGLVEFLHHEQARGEPLPFIIAHGVYLQDFPILLASCMKHNCESGILTECMFMDSMQFLQDGGYKKPRCTMGTT